MADAISIHPFCQFYHKLDLVCNFEDDLDLHVLLSITFKEFMQDLPNSMSLYEVSYYINLVIPFPVQNRIFFRNFSIKCTNCVAWNNQEEEEKIARLNIILSNEILTVNILD